MEYSYNALGNITAVFENGALKYSYEYDAMGNPLNYRGMTLTWRKGRQLESLQKDDGATLHFLCDSDGRRIQKFEEVADGSSIKETQYYWNGDQLAALQDGEDLIQFTYDEKGIPFSMKIGEDVYYYLYNVQGDVVGLLDSNGVEVVSYRYSSWGKILETFDTSDNQIAARNPFRYRGYILDEETGMYYLKSRYYDPETGRFLNADNMLIDARNCVGINLYAYCGNNFINTFDVNGNFAASIALSGTSAVAIPNIWNPIGLGIIIGACIGVGLGYLWEKNKPKIARFQTATSNPTRLGAAGKGVYSLGKNAINAKDKAKAQSISAAITSQTQYNYWTADLVHGQVVGGIPLTWEQAAFRVSMRQSIMCRNQDAAKYILFVNGYVNPAGPEKHGDGYYSHYHPTRNHTGYQSTHIWYFD